MRIRTARDLFNFKGQQGSDGQPGRVGPAGPIGLPGPPVSFHASSLSLLFCGIGLQAQVASVFLSYYLLFHRHLFFLFYVHSSMLAWATRFFVVPAQGCLIDLKH